MSVTAASHPIVDILIDPYRYAIANIQSSLSCRTHQVATSAIHESFFSNDPILSLIYRVGQLCIGLLLIVPLVNIVALQLFKLLRSPFVDPSMIIGNTCFGILGSSQNQTDDEAYLELKNKGDVLLPQEPAAQAPVAEEQYNQRKQAAIDRLRAPVAPQNAQVARFKCADEIMEFNLDHILARFNAEINPSRLSEFFDYAEVEITKRWELEGYFRNYGDRQPRERIIRQYFSKLFDFFNEKKAMFQGHQRENLFKAEIRYVFDKIIDAHRNCIDQVLSQVEGLMLDVIASFETAHIRGGLTREQALAHQAAYYLFKHKLDLIKTICVKEYPNEAHMADLERMTKQKLADILGLNGEIFEAGAQYNIVNDMDMKASNVAHIFLEGRPLHEYRGRAVNLARAGRRYAEDQFKPEEFFAEGLRTYHGEPRNLRNNILLWVRSYFHLDADNDQTREFIRAISEDEALTADEGGNLTTPALLHLLETIGVFERRP
ncbi:MAG: hypothetical protein K1X28_07375 [Parachlamydiales bacterium]|nr:hypothetical protein [Parachlamydiales bacterium]